MGLTVPRGGRTRAIRIGLLDWVTAWLEGSPAGLVVLALGVGLGAGAGAIVFRYLIAWCTLLFSGHPDFSAAGHAAHPLLPWLGIWFVVLAPVVGGLIYGPLVEFFAPEARGHGVPEVMLAVAQHGGRIRPQVSAIKALASAICIGAGGSVGREGPIVQVGSALGSTIGQLLRMPSPRLRLLVACGAAGGISATFNAPIAGVMFALELILQDFETQAFGVVVLASVAANVVGRAAFGSTAFLVLPLFSVASVWEFALYAGLGLLAALVGVAFIRLLYALEDLGDRLWRGPEWLRPGVGGVVLGLLILVMPEMYGVGYPVLEDAVHGDYTVPFLVLLVGAKMFATSLTIAIGGSGGVFAPSLFMGAGLGMAYGQALHALLPGITGSPGAYGLVGMGAVFAAASRAPITSLIIIFEMTGDYQVILPLMFSIALATPISHLLSEDTIYTAKLRRRGIDVSRAPTVNLMTALMVRDAMQPVPLVLPEDMPVQQAVPRVTRGGRDALSVVDAHGRYRGVITARRLEESLTAGQVEAKVGQLIESFPTVTDDQNLEEAVRTLSRTDGSGVPVLTAGGARPIGWLTHRDVLRTYNFHREAPGRRASRGKGKDG
jgi:chloride channel protein, CIC family